MLRRKTIAPGGGMDSIDLLTPMHRKSNEAQRAKKQFPWRDIDENDSF